MARIRFIHGCDHDYESELIDIMNQAEHDAGLCNGAPECTYCLDAEQTANESLGG